MRDTLFVNARFILPHRGNEDAEWLLARQGKIVSSGRGAVPAADEILDLGGTTVIPGPVDAHCHLVSYGIMRAREADLRGASSLSEIRRRLEAHLRTGGFGTGDGRWVLGRGFDQELLEEGRWPEQADLDAICKDRPVRITRVCGHAMVANRMALEQAGLPNHHEDGFPPGVVTEERMGAVYDAVPKPSEPEWRAAAEWACRDAAAHGFVGVHSLMAHAHEMRALVRLRAVGPLPVRVVMQPPYAMLDALHASGIQTGFGDAWLRYGAIKLFSDGSLGARTAAMLEAYSDAPGVVGELIYTPEELSARVRRIVERGFQVCIHAIGDRAMEVTVDAMEASEALRSADPSASRFPFRIEHASVVNARLVERMRTLGITAAVQPQFARSDSWSPDRLGPERVAGCYAFRTLHEAGIGLAGSTDCPVESMVALAAICQMVTRPDWSPQEAIPLRQALRIFSEGSYRLLGSPAGTGALEPGQHADFVALAVDPETVAPNEIESIPVVATVVGGRVVYAA